MKEYKFDALDHLRRGDYLYLDTMYEGEPGMEVDKYYELVFDPSGPKPVPYVFKVKSVEPSQLQPGKVLYRGVGRFAKDVAEVIGTFNDSKLQS